MDEQDIELGGLVLEAYVQHRIALARREWEDEQLLALFAAAEPIWGHLEQTSTDLCWTERRDAALAARDQRRAEILAARTREAA